MNSNVEEQDLCTRPMRIFLTTLHILICSHNSQKNILRRPKKRRKEIWNKVRLIVLILRSGRKDSSLSKIGETN